MNSGKKILKEQKNNDKINNTNNNKKPFIISKNG